MVEQSELSVEAEIEIAMGIFNYFNEEYLSTLNQLQEYETINPSLNKLTDVKYRILAVRAYLLQQHCEEHIEICSDLYAKQCK